MSLAHCIGQLCHCQSTRSWTAECEFLRDNTLLLRLLICFGLFSCCFDTFFVPLLETMADLLSCLVSITPPPASRTFTPPHLLTDISASYFCLSMKQCDSGTRFSEPVLSQFFQVETEKNQARTKNWKISQTRAVTNSNCVHATLWYLHASQTRS